MDAYDRKKIVYILKQKERKVKKYLFNIHELYDNIPYWIFFNPVEGFTT